MYKYIKRVIDIILALFLLIIMFIPMILIAIAIKLESDGSILFKQERTGKDGKPFNLYKFRSMAKENDVHNFKEQDKITKVGKFIRKTSLDELPQIFNILKGEMSFIGPRPWITDYYNNFNSYQKRRVEVKPGLTGLAQVNGRNDLSIFEKINYDITYIDNYSLIMDLKVVFMTIKTVFSKTGTEIGKYGIKEEINDLKSQKNKGVTI